MVRAEVIRKRLGKLDEYPAILRELRRYTFEEFVADPEHYGSAERFRQRVVHDYLGVDRRFVYEVMQQGLGDFEALRRVFAPLL